MLMHMKRNVKPIYFEDERKYISEIVSNPKSLQVLKIIFM